MVMVSNNPGFCKRRVLLVDDNMDFCQMVELFINKTDDIEVIGIANDGVEAVEKIIKLIPDVVILDLIMPNLDGIGVLEKIKNINFVNKPAIIILTAVGQDIVVRNALLYGVEYYFVKPMDINNLIKAIRQIGDSRDNIGITDDLCHEIDEMESAENISRFNEDFDNFQINAEVTALLYEAGISPHMLGHRYLKVAIICCINCTNPVRSITKELYPSIAEKFGTTPQKIDRSIRNCIEKAWIRTNNDRMDSLLGYSSNVSKSKPTNQEFISMISEKVKMVIKR